VGQIACAVDRLGPSGHAFLARMQQRRIFTFVDVHPYLFACYCVKCAPHHVQASCEQVHATTLEREPELRFIVVYNCC